VQGIPIEAKKFRCPPEQDTAAKMNTHLQKHTHGKLPYSEPQIEAKKSYSQVQSQPQVGLVKSMQHSYKHLRQPLNLALNQSCKKQNRITSTSTASSSKRRNKLKQQAHQLGVPTTTSNLRH